MACFVINQADIKFNKNIPNKVGMPIRRNTPYMKIVKFLIIFSILSMSQMAVEASYRMQKISFPYAIQFEQVKTLIGDNYLFLKTPCFVLLVNSRQGALDVPYWQKKLKEKYPSQNVYAVAGLAEMPGFIHKMTKETLEREPLVYFYDWKGSLNQQLFVLEDPFDHIKLKPPGLTLLIITSDKKLLKAPIELNKNIFYEDLFKQMNDPLRGLR